MGKYVDYYFENDRLIKMVDYIIRKNYGWIPQKDYDDFYSIAGLAVWYCEEHFDESKGQDFGKYLTDSLYRKVKTQITHYNRKKRNNGVPDLPIEKIIDEEGDMTVGDMIAAKEEAEIDPLVQRYMDSLTKTQKRVAELIMEGYDNKSIKEKLALSDERYTMICQRMKAENKTEPLVKLRKAMRGER